MEVNDIMHKQLTLPQGVRGGFREYVSASIVLRCRY